MNDLTFLAIFIVLLTAVWCIGCVIVDLLADERKGVEMSEELIEELDFIQPKKVVGEMISMSVIEDIKAEIVKIVTEIYAPTLILQIF